VTTSDIVTETRGVDYGELDLELLLLKLSLDDLDFRELVELLVVVLAVIFCSGELGLEERVDEVVFPRPVSPWLKGKKSESGGM
jgi:hypothetical protein